MEEEGYEYETEELEEHDGPRTFEVSGRTYSIKFTKGRLNLYEQRHKPIMASIIQNNGAFSVSELTAILAYGLQSEEGAYVNPRRGMEMAERLITTSGYLGVFEAVTDALQRDCGFLFKDA